VVELVLESPILGGQSLDFPAVRPLLLKALGETLPVYTVGFKAHGKVGIKSSPPIPAPFLKGLGDKIEPALYQIDGTLRFSHAATTCVNRSRRLNLHCR
jgi:hypothetical protein